MIERIIDVVRDEQKAEEEDDVVEQICDEMIDEKTSGINNFNGYIMDTMKSQYAKNVLPFLEES
jgi:hypothetical protein